MIQRIQTVYLLAAAILGLVHLLAWPLFAVQALATVLSLWAIFLFKQRPRQAKICLAAVLMNLAWYIVLAVLIQQGQLPESLPYTACLPLVAAILCFLARRGVLADEKLVRAADRIR